MNDDGDNVATFPRRLPHPRYGSDPDRVRGKLLLDVMLLTDEGIARLTWTVTELRVAGLVQDDEGTEQRTGPPARPQPRRPKLRLVAPER